LPLKQAAGYWAGDVAADVELALQASRAWNDGGVDAVLPFLDADVEWHPPAESMEPGIYRGHEGVRDYLGRLAEVFEEVHMEPLEVIDVDNEHVISVVRLIARSENSGMEINADWAWLITVGANKKGMRVETFTDKAQALEAVGLLDQPTNRVPQAGARRPRLTLGDSPRPSPRRARDRATSSARRRWRTRRCAFGGG